MNTSLRIKLLTALAPIATAFLVSPSLAQTSSCGSLIPTANFGLSLGISGSCAGFLGTTTAQEFFDRLSTTGIQSFSTVSYTGTQQATIYGRFNSLGMTLSFPNAVGSTAGSPNTLILDIPGLGINQTFTGSSRDASKLLLEDYIKKQGNILGRMLQYQAANAPSSPISGPGGLIPGVVASDFNSNFTDSATNIAAPANQAVAAVSGGTTPNLIGMALQYSAVDVLDSKIKVTTLPLSYTIRNDIDPRRQLTFSLPITQMDTNGAKSYRGGLGISYRVPLSDNWTLTPAGRYSIVGSVDMASVSSLYTASLTSTYIWNLDGFDVAMGNMLSYNKTGQFSAGDYSIDPGITNTVMRNGLMLSQPVVWDGTKLSLEYSLIDTRYTGSEIYVSNTQEIGFTIGTNKNAFSARSYLRGGVSLIRGKDTKGFVANIGYWF